MSWRSIFITKRSKLDLRMNHLVVRSDDLTTKIHLGEIDLLMIESTQVSLTTALLSELTKQKIRVVVCDEKHNPISELLPYYGCHDCSKRIVIQQNWDEDYKKELWKQIVFQKILNQNSLLKRRRVGTYYTDLLDRYLTEIEPADVTNREGLAAKVFFAGLYGKDFIRGSKDVENCALDYGYQMLLSCFNREIKACGYLTEIGIHHQNQHNFFNLSSDLMEPFRPLVDEIVISNNFNVFGTEEKRIMQEVLHMSVVIQNQNQVTTKAIKIYTKSILDSLLERTLKNIKWLQYEL